MTKVSIVDLKLNEGLFIRSSLNEDAVQRYVELFQSGKEKAIKIQRETFVVVDGWHRVEAAKRLNREKILADVLNIEDRELRTLAFRYNKGHGVPLSIEERNELINKLYFEDAKTQQQIADLMELTQQAISEIINNTKSGNANNDVENADKRRELTNKDQTVITRLALSGEKQEDIAKKFKVSQGRISQVWSQARDEVHKLYTEERLLKKEVAEKVELAPDEVDKILQDYNDPLNFEQELTTWWSAFGLDDRFGKKHKSNLPADLVRNILALYTTVGDVILDPAAGGGIVLDVANDMVGRKCYAYDLTPIRSDILTYNLFSGSPPLSPEEPNLIFLDLPYASQKQYSLDSSDLSNQTIETYLEKLTQIFGYWTSGILVVLMSSYRGKEGFADLPFEAEKRMLATGWEITEHIVNEHGKKLESQTGFWSAQAKKDRWLLRKHIHILVGKK